MKIIFTEAARLDYLWLQDNNKKLLKRLNLLVKDIIRDPYKTQDVLYGIDLVQLKN